MGKTVFDIVSESLKGKFRYIDPQTGKAFIYELHGLDSSYSNSLYIRVFDVNEGKNVTLSPINLKLLEEV